MSKLHPIYVALDGHQYNKAIKLASALPDSNVLGKALLAHAYSKSGQRLMSLQTLNGLVGGNLFELRREIDNSLDSFQEREKQPPKTNEAPKAAASKKGKKGKKKPAPVAKPVEPTGGTESTAIQQDLIDYLDHKPTLPENWEQLPPATTAITDEVSERALLRGGKGHGVYHLTSLGTDRQFLEP